MKEVISDGEHVAVRAMFEGTQQGEFFGTPPTGRSVHVSMIDTYLVEGGKIKERWGLVDQMGMMMQLGLMPGPVD